MRPPNGFQGFPQAKELPKGLVPALIDALKDEEKSVRQYAARTLVRVGKDAVGPLTDLLKGKDKAQRANAAYVLGQLGAAAEDALPLLIKALKDPDRALRVRAAFAIERVVAAVKKTGSMTGMPMGMPPQMRAMMGQADTKPTATVPPDPGTVPPAAKAKKGNRD
jgi:hypothetical protein